jgi:sigma-B regulation protein RsbU (phosphoserine phosphatase)
VGGDLYDVAPLPDGRLLLAVADVAGHGVAAALVTGMIKTALGASTREEPDLAATATAVLDTLAPLSQQRVITLLLVLANPRTRTIDYLNAGHPPAIVWGKEGTVLLHATTPLLSFGLELSKEPVRTHAFRPGDRLALYSDGMYEVRDPAGEEFGRERFTDTVVAAGPERLDQSVRRLVDQAVRHAGGRPPEDDLTLLLAEFAKG